MNVAETKMVLATLHAAFPQFYKSLAAVDVQSITKLWQTMFAEESYESVVCAVKALIATKVEGYPPTIGAVKEQLSKVTQDGLSEQDAWMMVSRACQNGYYNASAEFKKLPEAVRDVVGSPEQLRAWSQMDSETVESVVASNFMRAFRTKQKRKKELSMMPPDVRAFLSGAAEPLKIGGDAGDKKQLPMPVDTLQPVGLQKAVRKENPVSLPVADKDQYKPPTTEGWLLKKEAALKIVEKLQKEKEEKEHGKLQV